LCPHPAMSKGYETVRLNKNSSNKFAGHSLLVDVLYHALVTLIHVSYLSVPSNSTYKEDYICL